MVKVSAMLRDSIFENDERINGTQIKPTASPWAALVISAYGALKFSYSLFALPCATAIVLEAGQEFRA